ncbi:protein of unknown function [Nocardioides alpinus]|uniref:DUF1707 domain-containing protein n=1 Tax=Nocardioides alpinus TaxID=748909 RepID=A0A1I0ZR40_9ACTN|nr:DUF1707 domain-containing protein [Nocardioides alpinus]PKH41850.1 DUF1707 domain-containing protein [Nocardioides alpinus]SFB28115.1 protein of unknown function [Nocardioides alpinus]
MSSDIEVWSQFDHDPRKPANVGMRASDRDRAVIESVLADAFAEGRITRAEYDERTEAAFASRTLGDLMPLVDDLPVTRAKRSTEDDRRSQAVRRWESDRREALLGLIGLSTLLWTIWAATMWGGFPWPLFPMGFALMNLVRVVARKQDIIDEHVRELEKKELKELRRREELG